MNERNIGVHEPNGLNFEQLASLKRVTNIFDTKKYCYLSE